MKPIRIFQPDLTLLTEIDNYTSLVFTRRWHSPGEFELRINRHMKDANLLQKNNIVMLELSKAGIIKHIEIQLDEGGKGTETVLAKGYTLAGITKQRITIPPAGQAQDSGEAPAETLMKQYTNNNLVSPVDADRAFPLLVNATDQTRGGVLFFQSRYKNLAEELESLSLASELGWNVAIDITNIELVFDVAEGSDLTKTNTDSNPPVIFSPEFDSVKALEFVDSDLIYKNKAYVGGQGEGTAREVVEAGTGTGIERLEAFVDARDLDTVAKLQQRGLQRLAELAPQQVFSGRILKASPFEYEKDYDLGDIVTIQNKDWGVTLDARITEITETYEPAGFDIDATFGSARPTFIETIKTELSQTENEVTR